MLLVCVALDLVSLGAAIQPANQTNYDSTYVWPHTVCVITNCYFYFYCLCICCLPVWTNKASSIHSINHVKEDDAAASWRPVWFHDSISPSVRLTCYFHTSFVTTWLMSNITKHSPPLLLFQSTPSPSNTRGLPYTTPQHGTPPIAATAQIHSTTCQA